MGGRLHLYRHVRVVLHLFPVVHAFPADDRYLRGQRCHTLRRPAHAGGRGETERTTLMATTEKPYGLIAEFEKPADIIHAAERVRDAGFRRWDTFTPFPVHGMDRA